MYTACQRMRVGIDYNSTHTTVLYQYLAAQFMGTGYDVMCLDGGQNAALGKDVHLLHIE